jgi:hypothetical protein
LVGCEKLSRFLKKINLILLQNFYCYGNDQIDQASSNIILKNQKKKKTTNVENKTFA